MRVRITPRPSPSSSGRWRSRRIPVRCRDADAHRAATDFVLIALRFGILPFFNNDYGGATPSATSTAFGWGFSLSTGGVPSASDLEGERICRSGGLTPSTRTITTGVREPTQGLCRCGRRGRDQGSGVGGVGVPHRRGDVCGKGRSETALAFSMARDLQADRRLRNRGGWTRHHPGPRNPLKRPLLSSSRTDTH